MAAETATPSEQARQHELRGDLAEASRLWLECLAIDPTSYDLWLGYGRTLCHDGQYQGACDALAQALTIDGRGAEALFFMARAEVELGRLSDAQAHFRRAVALDPLLDHPQLRSRLLGVEIVVEDEHHGPAYRAVSPRTAKPLAATVRTPRTRLSDVWGHDALKSRLQKEIVDTFDTATASGMLMFGPQDCGKQFVCRALAAELGGTVLEVECETLQNMGAREQVEHDIAGFLSGSPSAGPRIVALLRLEKLFTTTQSYGRATRRLPAALSFLRPVVTAPNSLVCFHSDVPWLLSRSVIDSHWLRRAFFVPPPDDVARGQILDSAFGTIIPRPVREAVVSGTDGYSTGDLREFTIMMQQYITPERDENSEQLERYLEEDRSHVGSIDWSMAPHVLSQLRGAFIEWLREARIKQLHRRYPEVQSWYRCLEVEPARRTRSRSS